MDASSAAVAIAGLMGRRALCAAAIACCLPVRIGAAPAQGADAASWNVRPWPKGRATPVLRLNGLDGQRFSLAALKGRVVLLNFWASWCEPCRAEMPALQDLARRYERQGLSVVAINYQEGEPGIRRFLQGTPLTLPILLDGDGTAARAWTPLVFPSTVVVGRDGRAVFTVVGEADWSGEHARRSITPLLGNASKAQRSPAAATSP